MSSRWQMRMSSQILQRCLGRLALPLAHILCPLPYKLHTARCVFQRAMSLARCASVLNHLLQMLHHEVA